MRAVQFVLFFLTLLFLFFIYLFIFLRHFIIMYVGICPVDISLEMFETMFIFFRPLLPQFWRSVEFLLNSLWIMLQWLIIHVTVILIRAEWIVFVNADFLQNYSFLSCLMHCIQQSATLHLQECLVQLIHTFIYFETRQKTISQHFLRRK